LFYLKDPSIVCGKDFNFLSQNSSARTELATKPKDGMAINSLQQKVSLYAK
jgi:hypothetical protein